MTKLSDAPLFTPLRIKSIDTSAHAAISRRLLELGFIPDSIIEVRHEGPVLNDPLAVLVRGMVVALRRSEAHLITVEILPETTR
jgi:Fe2+ transport system protein FeoA